MLDAEFICSVSGSRSEGLVGDWRGSEARKNPEPPRRTNRPMGAAEKPDYRSKSIETSPAKTLMT